MCLEWRGRARVKGGRIRPVTRMRLNGPSAALSSGGDLTHGESDAAVFFTGNPGGKRAVCLSNVRISKRLGQPMRVF